MKNRRIYSGSLFLFLLITSVLLTACMSRTSYAPVRNASRSYSSSSSYIVKKGDTVYSIAWLAGEDYRTLAAANGLHPPYAIYPGQRLHFHGSPKRSYVKYGSQEKVVKVYHEKSAKKEPAWRNIPVSHWRWPAKGRVVDGFSSARAGNHGINIAGHLGEPIHAAASGQVVYSGDGVRGYGNLLIIKHNDSYLSAYAFNKKLLVKLGQRVRSGQTVAEMGRNNAGRVMLHFEIRRNGKPVNPERYLH